MHTFFYILASLLVFAGNSRGDKSAACDFTSSNTSTWVSQNVHPSRRSAVGDEIADGPIPFKSFSYDLMIKRFGVDPILFQFRSDEPLIGDSKGFSCLSFDVYHFSKQWGQIKLWAGNTFEWKKQLLWSRPRSIFDQWETYSVTLTKEMQVLTFESDLKLIAFSAIRHQIGACDPNSYIDFETDIKSWFKTKQSGALEFVRKQAGNNRVDVLDNSLDDQLDMNNTYIDAYEENNELFDYLPKIDVTTETGHGHYVTVRSSDKNSKTKMSVIETEFNLSENSEAIFLEFYAHNVARGKCHTIQMYVREKDANISTANLKQMVYDSDSTTTDLLMNPWQKYHVLILVGNRFKLSIHAYQQKGADCAPAIDHLRVYTVESIRFRDDNEVNYMLGCDFDYSLCNFQNIPTEKNSWLIAPGRIDSKKYIRIPGASRFVGETKLVSYAYADFSGDSASNIGVLRLAGVRLSTYVSHENCVTVVYWIDYNVSRTIARFTVRIVNENVNLVVFESNEPTNRKWIKALIPVHQNGNYRLVFEAEVADLSVPAFIAIKSVNLNLGRCFDNLTLPLIEAVHDLSCDFIEDTCGWKKTGNSGWDNQVERFSIFPRSNSYVSYLRRPIFVANPHDSDSKELVGRIQSPIYRPNTDALLTYCVELEYFIQSTPLMNKIRFIKVDESDSSDSARMNETIFELVRSENIYFWHKGQVSMTSYGPFSILLEGICWDGHVAIRSIATRTGHCDRKQISNDENFWCDFEHDSCSMRYHHGEINFKWAIAGHLDPTQTLVDHTLQSKSGHVYVLELLPDLIVKNHRNGFSTLPFFIPEDVDSACISFWTANSMPFNLEVKVLIAKSDASKLRIEYADREWTRHTYPVSLTELRKFSFSIYVELLKVEDHLKTGGYVAIDDIKVTAGECPSTVVCTFERECDWSVYTRRINYTQNEMDGKVYTRQSDLNAYTGWESMQDFVDNDSSEKINYLRTNCYSDSTLISNTKFLDSSLKEICVRFIYQAEENAKLDVLMGPTVEALSFAAHYEMPLKSKWTQFGVTLPVSTSQTRVALNIQQNQGFYFDITNLQLQDGACPEFYDYFKCNDDEHKIIHSKFRCDFNQDCPNNADEIGCGECEFGRSADRLTCGYYVKVYNESQSSVVGTIQNEAAFDSTQSIASDLLRINTPSSIIVHPPDHHSVNMISPILQQSYAGCLVEIRYITCNAKLSLNWFDNQDRLHALYETSTDQFSLEEWQTTSIQIGRIVSEFQLELRMKKLTNSSSLGSWIKLDSVRMLNCNRNGKSIDLWKSDRDWATNAVVDKSEKEQFSCEYSRSIESFRRCDFVDDCGNNNDEVNCDQPSTYRTDFTENYESALRLRGHLKTTKPFHHIHLGPLRDHTRKKMAVNRFAFISSRNGTSKSGSVVGIVLQEATPKCHIRMAYIESKGAQVKMNFEWIALDRVSSNESIQLPHVEDWRMLRIPVHTLNVKTRPLRLNMHFEVIDGYIGIDDISLSEDCYPQTADNSECRFWVQSNDCIWDIIQKSPDLSLISFRSTDKLFWNLEVNRVYMFSFTGLLVNATSLHVLNPPLRLENLEIEAPSSIPLYSIVFRSPLMELKLYKNQMYLRIKYGMFGVDVGEIRLVDEHTDRVLWRTFEAGIKSVVDNTEKFVKIADANSMQLPKVRLEMTLTGSRGLIALMSASPAINMRLNGLCTFDEDGNACEFLRHMYSESTQLEQGSPLALSSAMPDHTLKTDAGSYLFATAKYGETFKRIRKTGLTFKLPSYCLSFWVASTSMNEKSSNHKSNQLQFADYEFDQSNTSTERTFFEQSTKLALIYVQNAIDQRKFFAMEAALNRKWSYVQIFANHAKSLMAEIAVYFKTNATYEQLVGIDDLLIERLPCTALNCDFDQNLCGWYTPDAFLSSYTFESGRWLLLSKEDAKQLILPDGFTVQKAIVYTEFVGMDPVKKIAVLSSPQMVIPNGKVWLNLKLHFAQDSQIEIHVFTQDARKRIRLATLRPSVHELWTNEFNVIIPSLSAGQFSQEIWIVAKWNSKPTTDSNKPDESDIDYVLIYSVSVTQRSFEPSVEFSTQTPLFDFIEDITPSPMISQLADDLSNDSQTSNLKDTEISDYLSIVVSVILVLAIILIAILIWLMKKSSK